MVFLLIIAIITHEAETSCKLRQKFPVWPRLWYSFFLTAILISRVTAQMPSPMQKLKISEVPKYTLPPSSCLIHLNGHRRMAALNNFNSQTAPFISLWAQYLFYWHIYRYSLLIVTFWEITNPKKFRCFH